MSLFRRLVNNKLDKNHSKYRIVLVSALGISIIVFSLTFFSLSINKAYMGINLTLTDNGWAVNSLDPNGVAAEAGIIDGDRPIEINGQPADIFLSVRRRRQFMA